MKSLARGLITFLIWFLGVQGAASGQSYPSKPLRLIISFAPGGTTDLVARIYANRLRAQLGQPVIVENRPGAESQIAIDVLRKAEPDGYTIMLEGPSLTTLPIFRKGFSIDYTKDITPVATLVNGSLCLIVPAAAPFQTLDELVAHMRANPGKVNWSTGAPVSAVIAEMFKAMTGTKFEIVRYGGSAPAVQAIMSGQADLNFIALGAAKDLRNAGKVRILVVTSDKRSSFAPDVTAAGESSEPGVRELSRFSGFAGFFYGILGPGGMPRQVVNVLNVATLKIAKEPEFEKRMRDFNYEIIAGRPEEYAKALASEAAMYARAAKQAGIEPQ